jgi:DNA adenine methylase
MNLSLVEPDVADPIFRWAGSKRRLVPRLEQFWNGSYTRYVEPFAGSACLFFRLEPEAALIGDLNQELIESYEVLRSDPEAVHAAFATWQNCESTYYEVRSLDTRTLSAAVRAARFVYLNRFCFNGLFRTNRQGRFNVPYGGRKSGQMPTLVELDRIAGILSGAELYAGDFGKVLSRTKPGDFVYIDPPYSVSGRRVFKEYDRAIFAEADLVRLRDLLAEMDKRGVHFVISYADSDEGRHLTDGYRMDTVPTRRNIAGFASKRRGDMEILATNIATIRDLV